MIIREKYLKKIRPFYNQDLIKVLTGIRRCGKSTTMKQIVDELKTSGIADEQIIYINFEDEDYNFIKNDQDLNEYIKGRIKNNEKYYLLFDEIQNVEKWEKAINSFKATKNVSIFITGSNSDLLSGELATHLAGRYVSFRIMPFTFEEVCELQRIDKNDKAKLEELFNNYIMWGGLPQRFSMEDDEQVKTYLNDVYNSIVIKDIVERYSIKDLDLLNRIAQYVMTTPSQNFSAENLSNYFLGSDQRVVSKTTLYNYLEYLSNAMMINKAERYDIRGKRILTGKYKYYLTDLGLGQIKNTGKKLQLGAYLENIVYNQLVSDGYEVNVGNTDNGEIDFIANKFNEKKYFQVTYILADDDTINREFGAYNNITDNYPKYVLSLDKFDMSQNGIVHKNIIEWLLEENR